MEFLRQKTGFIYLIALFFCFMPFVSPALALLTGISFSLFKLKNEKLSAYSSLALQASIVLMGFGMNLPQVIHTSKAGFADTAISVSFVLTAGILLGKLLRVDSKVSLLVASGTAICGGSAIAAVAPVIQAKNHQISFSLIVVFVLNAIALVLFPYIGHHFHLSQETFGYWSAIAIHDTSSVVGAGASYGEKALQIATTVKLVRSLWIIPLALLIALFQKNQSGGKVKIPWFILLFVASMLVAYFFPSLHETYSHFNWLGRKGMIAALFLIGANISVAEAKQAGIKSFLLGLILWILIAVFSFLALTL